MLMHSIERGEPARRSIAQAIRAIEQQRSQERAAEAAEVIARREAFFRLLDGNAVTIFNGIERAALNGTRQFMLGTMPGFDARCAKIFSHLGAGFFETNLLDDWLHARDLSHILHATELGVEW